MRSASVIERLLGSLGVVFGAVTLVFLILNWLPGDPAELIAGEDASEETVAQVRAQLGTAQPLGTRYVRYIGGLLRGDLGQSYVTREPVAKRLAAQFPATLKLTVLGCAVAVAVGVGLGVLSARHAGGWIDQAVQAVALGLHSMPSFWLGILLILLFSVTLGWLPVIGRSPAAMVLPVSALGLVVSVPIMRMVRDGMLEGLHEPYVTTLRAKGLGEARIFYVHVLRNALIPTVTLLGLVVGELLSGAVIIETLYARQGIGRITVEAIGQKDIPVVQGTILVAAVGFVVVNLLVDLSYTLIDPRVRK
ncbi:ABC transporter permease [Xylophilus sp.]|uniref:ABC transporter permease n=1 Tax=Xylophilus sp. TaxID=2653893 RepID=UPI0013B7C935|nr:ABC transporter permease [Xylophilus sp.]KAF1042973.1 MAG: Glutathione transport system permease protein GsiC [Xylophilus sp.]